MNNKNRKLTCLMILIVIVLSLLIYNFNVKKYDINVSFNAVQINSERDLNNYLSFIKKYVKPKELVSFVNYNELHLSNFTDRATGNTVLEEMTYSAYDSLFNSFFDRERKNFDDCPVTNNFKSKFHTNLFEYFDFYSSEDAFTSCSIDYEKLLLDIEEAGNFVAGEPGYIYYHHFHYTLDEEGNVDDIIFDYTE